MLAMSKINREKDARKASKKSFSQGHLLSFMLSKGI
jgi:hypothetical protein